MGYDDWLEAPYQRAQEQAERLLCPACEEGQMEEDPDGGADCPECGHVEPGPDWDAIAEARAEARADYYNNDWEGYP